MKRLPYLLISCLILLLPSQLSLHFWPTWSLINGVRVDYLSPTLYVTDIIAILFIVTSGVKLFYAGVIIKKSWIYACAIFFLFGALNIAFSVSPPLSLYKWLKLFELLLLGGSIYLQKKMVIEAVVTYLPITLIWTSLLAIAQWIHQGTLGGLFYWLGERSFTVQTPGIALSKIFSNVSLRPYATLPHPNVLSGFLLISLLVLFYYHKRSRSFWLACALSTLVILITESYAVWLAALVIIVVLFACVLPVGSFRYAKAFIVTQVFVLSLLSPVFLHAAGQLPLFTGFIKERMELMYVAGFVSKSQQLQGVGLGAFTTQIPEASLQLPSSYRGRVTSWLQPVHNVPLLVFSETGIIGITALFIISWLTPVTAPFIAIGVISLFDHYWLTLQQPLLLLVFVGSLFVKGGRK